MNIVEMNINKIHDLCVTYKVGKLFVFGSVLTNRFNVDFFIIRIIGLQIS